jgi:hypothetical protein
VRCFRNELMSGKRQETLPPHPFNTATPKARFISPSVEVAAHLFDAAADAGKPGALAIFTADHGRLAV